MSRPHKMELMELLDTDEQALQFIEQMPSDAARELVQAVRDKLDREKQALDEAIQTGSAELPAPLGALARSLLS